RHLQHRNLRVPADRSDTSTTSCSWPHHSTKVTTGQGQRDTPWRLDYGGTLRLGFEPARHPSDLGGDGMTTRLRWWIVPLVGLLLAAPVCAGAVAILRYAE